MSIYGSFTHLATSTDPWTRLADWCEILSESMDSVCTVDCWWTWLINPI